MHAPRLSTALLALSLASAAVAAEPPCAPEIVDPWVRAAPPGATTLAGYLELRNGCGAPVAVVDVESLDFGMPMIHRTVEEGGVSRMRPAGRLEVKPGQSLRFEPGGDFFPLAPDAVQWPPLR